MKPSKSEQYFADQTAIDSLVRDIPFGLATLVLGLLAVFGILSAIWQMI